jgi:periplasmic divalent cation tolerance protein
MQAILILWTCKDVSEARRIANALLEKRFIACASIVPTVESYYLWEGKIEHAQECKVFLKTIRQQFIAVRDYILTYSSYEIPEILELSIQQGNPAYLAWLQNELKS